MKEINSRIDRLLKSAATAGEEVPVSVPFGFETRVVALWRESPDKGNGLAGLLRRVSILSAAVLVVSTGAVFYETNQTRQAGESLTNEFAIADSAIQDELPR